MNSSPHHYNRPPYGHGMRPRGSPPSALSPRSHPSTTHSYPSPPGQPQYPSPSMPIFSTPPPWYPTYPPPPPSHYYTHPPHLLPSPLTNTSTTYTDTPTTSAQSGLSSPGSFYMHPDMPSPMMPPQQKRKRFTPIRGRGGRGSVRQHHNRSFHRGRGRGKVDVGSDAYYDRFMFEDPWRDLLPQNEDSQEEENDSTQTPVQVDSPIELDSAISCTDDARGEEIIVSPLPVSPQSQSCGDETAPVT